MIFHKTKTTCYSLKFSCYYNAQRLELSSILFFSTDEITYFMHLLNAQPNNVIPEEEKTKLLSKHSHLDINQLKIHKKR